MSREFLHDARRLAAIALIVLLAMAPARRAARPLVEADLRDAVASAPPLGRGHAGLARDGRSSCSYCHADASARSPYLPVWGGAAWKPEAPAAPSSSVCMSCHDDALAGGAVHKDAHPVGMDYEAARRRSPDRLNDISGRADIRLDGGRVGCLSCHEIHRGAEGAGGGDRPGSKCEACHRL